MNRQESDSAEEGDAPEGALQRLLESLLDGDVHECDVRIVSLGVAHYAGLVEIVPGEDSDARERRRAANTCGVQINDDGRAWLRGEP